jgi:hypothetical protein
MTGGPALLLPAHTQEVRPTPPVRSVERESHRRRPSLPRPPRPQWPTRRQVPAIAALPVAVALWIVSLSRHVALGRMGGFGLITVLPMTYWAGVVVLTLGFAYALYCRGIASAWFLGYVVALIAMLHATPTILYGTLRYGWAWKHVAVVDYLLRHGATDRSNGDLGVYHQWPGFFSLNALFARMAGEHTAAAFAAWAPPVNNLLLIGPLVLIFRTLTRDRRLIWAAVWIFFSCSWVGQDYFSPQAFAFFLYLALVAVVLNRLGPARSRRGVVVWIALLLPVIAAVDSSHQLTPLMLVCATGLLAIGRRRRRLVLPLFLAATVFAVAWDGTVGWPFIQANLHSILKSFGALDANASSRISSQASR